MQNTRLSFKQDDFGNAMEAKVCWSPSSGNKPKPIALIFHGGAYIVGSCDAIPPPQINWLVEQNFLVVIPNFRLAPQVTAATIFTDCEDAHDWATQTLPSILESSHGLTVDTQRVVTLGYSAGGTLAIHIGSVRPVKAATAFYPSLFSADKSTTAHHPSNAPPFDTVPKFELTQDDWNEITPSGKQLTAWPFPVPGKPLAPRSKWQLTILKHGLWMKNLMPTGEDGKEADLTVIDPMTRLSTSWPAVMIVQGANDNVPGSNPDLARRAEKEMKAAGVEAELTLVAGAAHLFDVAPGLGTTDLGDKWQAVVHGLHWLKSHV